MSVFQQPDFDDHEHVAFFSDQAAGLKCVIAVHNTNLGPALGGLRIWPYADEDAALTDALRLSRGMTYKSALAGLSLGGGKAVVIADPRRDKTEDLLRAFGRAVDRLAGKYITAEDVGSTVADLQTVRRETEFVAGIPDSGGEDPSSATAYGVYRGIKAAARHVFGSDSLYGLTVALQGAGNVGRHLAELLHEAKANLIVADINPAAVADLVQRFGATAISTDKIHMTCAEVFAPCALGASLNDQTIPELRARIVAGSANNQLAEARHGAMLREHGILYAPDYAINAGGVINIAHEGPGYDRQAAFAHVGRIQDTLAQIFELSDREGIATSAAADRLAEDRFMTKAA
ncbi:MAG: Glu/Leu/Phe/Val dehydrogenase [Rhodospirillaceae bacterium]|nr:Glu/Leu/Phe/Val dehydrogenase [Rhodospirillaceae bacterium]